MKQSVCPVVGSEKSSQGIFDEVKHGTHVFRLHQNFKLGPIVHKRPGKEAKSDKFGQIYFLLPPWFFGLLRFVRSDI